MKNTINMKYKQHFYDSVAKRHVKKYQPYDHSWHSRNELFNDWTSLISNVFPKMKCCALCGFVKLSHHNQYFKRKTNTYNDQISPLMGCTPYEIAYFAMAKYTTNENGEYMYICTKCDKQE